VLSDVGYQRWFKYGKSIDNKMKNKKPHTVGTVQKSYRKIVERGKIDTLT